MTERTSQKSTRDEKFFTIYKDLISSEKKEFGNTFFEGEKIEDVATEMQRIKNRGLKSDIKMKERTLLALFIFLGVETFFIFLFAFFQALKFCGFAMEEWSFKLLISATISQITIMLVIAVKHLFPNK